MFKSLPRTSLNSLPKSSCGCLSLSTSHGIVTRAFNHFLKLISCFSMHSSSKYMVAQRNGSLVVVAANTSGLMTAAKRKYEKLTTVSLLQFSDGFTLAAVMLCDHLSQRLHTLTLKMKFRIEEDNSLLLLLLSR